MWRKDHLGAVSKAIANHVEEGRSLSSYAYQYFENVQNFLVAVEEMKLPTFEQESLQPGSTANIVDYILALKDYYEWKQCGGNGPLRTTTVSRKTRNFLQQSTPCVPVKAPETLPNPSVGNIDEGEKRLDDIVQSNDFILED